MIRLLSTLLLSFSSLAAMNLEPSGETLSLGLGSYLPFNKEQSASVGVEEPSEIAASRRELIEIKETPITTREERALLDKSEDYYLNPNLVHVVLEPIQRAILSSQVTAKVLDITKEMGDKFEEGDLLVELDDAIYRAAYRKAKALLRQAQLSLETKQQLYDDDIGSLIELREAQAGIATAEAEIAIAKTQMDACKVLAPYPGRFVARKIQEFELAQPGTPLIEILGDHVILAKMLINSTKLKIIKIGDTINVRFRDPKISVKAKIINIGAEIDPASSTIKVDARILNPDPKLIPGMTGTAILKPIGDTKKNITPLRQYRSPIRGTPMRSSAPTKNLSSVIAELLRANKQLEKTEPKKSTFEGVFPLFLNIPEKEEPTAEEIVVEETPEEEIIFEEEILVEETPEEEIIFEEEILVEETPEEEMIFEEEAIITDTSPVHELLHLFNYDDEESALTIQPPDTIGDQENEDITETTIKPEASVNEIDEGYFFILQQVESYNNE